MKTTLSAASLMLATLLGACAIEDASETDDELGTSEDAITVFQWSASANITTATSKNAVGLAAYGGNVHMVHTGGIGKNLYHTVYDGTSWSSTSQIPNQQSKDRPALESYPTSRVGGLLHMVHQGSSSNDLWWSTFNGSWTPNTNLRFSSRRPPALVNYGGRLHLFGTFLSGTSGNGTQTECLFESTFDGSTWSPTVGLSICGVEGFDAAYYDGTPILVIRDVNNNLRMRRFQNNVWSAPTIIPGQKSQSAPELAVFDGVLHMTHLGDTSQSVWWSYFNGTSWSSNNSIPSHSAEWVTSMAPLGTKLVQAYPQSCTTTDCVSQLRFSTFQ